MSRFVTIKNNDLANILTLIIILTLFLLPLILGIEGICYDDAAFISFPRLMQVARAFQNGELPFWDSNSYSGAKPFYTMMEAPIYNIFFYPFYFLADLNNINQSFFVLYIIPFSILTIFAGIGFYFFTRKSIKTTATVAMISGVMYALNPSMGISSLSLIDTTVFSYIPWILLSVTQYLETYKLRWWLLTVFFFVMLNTAYTLNYTFRIYFFIGIIILIIFIWYFIQNKKNIKYITAIVFSIILAFALTAFVWLGIIEGLSWVKEKVSNRLTLMLKEITYSLPPLHLITLFIPGFNGTLSNEHTWGDGFLVHSADRILSGGVITSLLVFVSLIVLLNKKLNLKVTKIERLWLIIGNFVNFFALLIMLGKYSPVFLLLGKLFPWFFCIPFPFYYHFAQHLGVILTVSVVLNIIFNNEQSIDKLFTKRLIFSYLGFIIIFAIIYLFFPVYYPKYFAEQKFLNFQVLLFYNDLLWFIIIPVGYFLLMSVVLIFAEAHLKKNSIFFLNFLVVALLFEAFFIGYPILYKNQIMPRAYSLNNWQEYRRIHKNFPTNFEYFKQIEQMKKILKKESSRFTADVSILENLSWVTNTRSFTGYDAKPIFEKMNKIVNKFYNNWPYEMWAYLLPKRLLSNMNVGYILIYEHKLGENRVYEYKDGEIDYYSIAPIEYIKQMKENAHLKLEEKYRSNFKKAEFKIHMLEEPLPYLYFQNRIVVENNEEEQFKKLLYFDLREAVFAKSEFEKIIKPQLNKDIDEKKVNYLENFKRLQEKNKILKVDMKKNNRLELFVDINEPCFLIRVEAYHPDWEVKINGKKGKIVCVNFFQQGVYLEKGRHEIVFSFFPKAVLRGFIISIVSFIGILGIILVFFVINIIYKLKIKNK